MRVRKSSAITRKTHPALHKVTRAKFSHQRVDAVDAEAAELPSVLGIEPREARRTNLEVLAHLVNRALARRRAHTDGVGHSVPELVFGRTGLLVWAQLAVDVDGQGLLNPPRVLLLPHVVGEKALDDREHADLAVER